MPLSTELKTLPRKKWKNLSSLQQSSDLNPIKDLWNKLFSSLDLIAEGENPHIHTLKPSGKASQRSGGCYNSHQGTKSRMEWLGVHILLARQCTTPLMKYLGLFKAKATVNIIIFSSICKILVRFSTNVPVKMLIENSLQTNAHSNSEFWCFQKSIRRNSMH